MTETATAQGATATVLSGRTYPAAAVVDAEKYWWHLARLRESRTREEAARHALALHASAAHIADALTGALGAVPDTGTDPVAWADLCTWLARLGIALDGKLMYPGPVPGTAPEDSDPGWDAWDPYYDDEDWTAWGDLPRAVSRRGFAAAWYPIRLGIEALAAPRADGTPPPLRAFTAAQVIQAATAVIDAPW